MIFGSVCSGIEAASVAWEPLGWSCAFVSEVDRFPCALLSHYWPSVPNYGDLNECAQWPVHAIDVLVGGTPCQDFSVAGQRAGLGGARGGLTMRFLDCLERYAPAFCVWENVPGVLSIDAGAAFGAFLGGLAKRGYGFAYRVLDAQYFGLAQRRERVFVVGCAGGQWQRAAAVLFDAPRLRWNPPPRRQARQGVAPTVRAGAPNCGPGHGARSGDSKDELIVPVIAKPQRTMSGGIDREDMHTLIAFAQNQRQEVRELNVAGSQSSIRRGDAKNETLIAHTLRAEGYDASEDGTGRSVPLVSCAVKARDGKGPSSDGDGDGLPLVPVAFRAAGQMGFTPAQVTPPINATDGGGAGVPTMNCGMAVRRLTPREVERLQGFPDDYTLVHYRGKPACDGPRYRALGNSMAVPVMAWLGRRIALIASL